MKALALENERKYENAILTKKDIVSVEHSRLKHRLHSKLARACFECANFDEVTVIKLHILINNIFFFLKTGP